MLTPQQAATRAQAGAKYLDETDPSWASRIDVETLDISSKCHCVLGQLHGDFDLSSRGLSYIQLIDYGFEQESSFGSLIPGYKQLTAAWREIIEERQVIA